MKNLKIAVQTHQYQRMKIKTLNNISIIDCKPKSKRTRVLGFQLLLQYLDL